MKKSQFYLFISILFCSSIFYSCAEYKTHRVVSTTIMQTHQVIPEEELVDVGITVFETDDLTEEKAKEEGIETEVTAVTIPEVEITKVKNLAEKIGVKFTVRQYIQFFW